MEEASSSDILEAEIVGISFALATHRQIRLASISDAGINHASQLSNAFLGLPLEFGKCEACGATEPDKCEGHFGYIHLPVPIYHPAHVSELKQMLSLLCLKCLKIKKIKSTSSGLAERLLGVCCEEASNITIKDKSSDGASYLQLKLPSRTRLQEGFWNFLERYGYRYGSDHTRPLLAREVKEILRRIPEETRKKLTAKGHIPQEGYILEYLPVPPNCLSVPEVSDGSNSMSVDPSRIELKDVLRKVVAISNSRSGETNFESHRAEANEMFRVVDTYLQVRGTAKPTRNIDMRFGVSKISDSSSSKAWTEKMRTLFIRKGSGFSSRSVITGDAFRNVNEVGIPMEIAHRITFEERVSVHNIGYLQELVDNKMCLSYTQGSTTYSLRDGSKGHTVLKPGQIVHRRVMDGDVVFINRPPTTHKHSLQALRVYVHEDNTVKINPLMCGPLSADFDGDCVHLFYPQSLTAKAEVLELFSVDKQLRSSHTGQLILQLGLDSLLSLRVMMEQVFLDKASAQQLAMYGSRSLPSPAVVKSSKSGPAWTFFQILQLAFPERLSCRGDGFIVGGSDLLSFDFGVDALASIINGIVTAIMVEKGPKEALAFFDSLQPLLMEHLDPQGFSLSLEDLSMSREDMGVIHNLIVREISPMVSRLRLSYEDELQLENSIQKVKEVAANFMLKSYSMRNLIDIKSNSAINKLVQQIGFLGLQLSDKKKLYTKTLVEDMAQFYKKKYVSTSSSGDFGIVKGCFFHGLDPYEEMAHSVAAREVIVRSSRGLAEPGTLFKNLMAVLRDIVITNDGSVRNTCSNSIVQFKYELSSDNENQGLFEAGDPVGVLAATAMSNPAYKAVLDSSPNSNSSWELMKEVLLCKVNFQNTTNDRRVILYLNECRCGKKYCQENSAYTVRNKLKKVSLKDTAVEFLVEYRKQQAISEIFGMDICLHGHIHLNKTLLEGWNISMQDILQRCEDAINSLVQKKKKKAEDFKKMNLSVSECCSFRGPGSSKDSDMPCLMFSSYNATDPDLERTLDVLCNTIYPVLLETVIKGDPRIASANIIWNSPETTTWIRSRHASRRGEWVLDVTVEKADVKQSGDAWRVVIDSCLSVLHLIDTKRSIPYSIKQVQELLGLSCAFEQAVQRLSASVRKVSKGVLKEHIILVANNMTCSGDMLGFNSGGYKALTRSLNIKAPFTEATLIAPRKCFEKAAEKCHKDSLSTVVGSCSWGKRVDVGTGSQFELLWNKKETGLENDDETDVFSFLQMVRSTKTGDAYVSSPGFDVTEEEMAEWAESPERDSALGEPKFDDSAEFQNLLDEGKASESKWDNGSLWENGCSSGSEWGVSKNAGGEENTQSGWGKAANVENEDASSGWNSKKDAQEATNTDSWGAWGSKTKDDAENATPNWGTKPAQNDSVVIENGEPSSDVWGPKAVSDKPWGKKNSETEPAPAAWGKKNSESESAAAAWGSSDKKNTGTESDAAGWGSAYKKNPETELNAAAWGSGAKMNKETEPAPAAWGSWGKKSSETVSGGADWGIRGKRVSETESGAGGWASRNRSLENQSGGATWGSRDKSKFETESGGAAWGSQAKNNSETEPGSGAAAWGTWDKKKPETETGGGGAAWGSQAKNNSETESGSSAAAWGTWDKKKSETELVDGAWGSQAKKNSETESGAGASTWGAWDKKKPETETGGGGAAWGSQAKNNSETESGSGGAAWGKKKSETDSGGGAAWGSQAKKNSESQLGAANWGSKNTNNSENGSDSAAWGKKKNSEAEPTSVAWGSWGQPSPPASDKDAQEDDGNPWVSLKATNSGEKEGNETSQWGVPNKRYPSAGSQSQGGGGGADWKRNRPPRTPGSESILGPMFTATRQRVDMFTSEEQELLSDVDPVMRRLRKIMHQSGYTDGEPISDEDKTYVLEQILNYHPDKDAKLGPGLDFITVDKHTTFTESRCFFVVSTDGTKQDFSYRKCINNYLVEKHPNLAEEFIAKYFRKRDNENRDKNSQEATPPGEQESQTQPIDNGSQDSQPQPIGNEGGDTQPQSQAEDTQPQSQIEDIQPIGNGGEDSQTEPQA
ncbi:PREDICTED: DNA-directed RNA polymerase V subunit 1 isoform X1 [Brassica oleracea var. oleracea]|uniref:DNA-directed RNA polymerase subunit n=1 Tax=Brassica oleracea var. oleracea TaxID=109376 RepID=A0A0D3B5Z0_BRAOL|nr:PREDICTED: DNA-directed RNA polymerase V subunit 1 isoform X1 [Brassica oleracea var. oleracea]